MNRRDLTPAEKAGHVATWLSRRADFEQQRPRLNLEPAGLGFPDPEVYRLTDSLNAIEGLCTIQSCSGHRINGVQQNANLWLRLSEAMTAQFLECAADLADERPAIERVQLVFGAAENQIVEILFQGLNIDARRLAEASEIIVAFFRRLAKEISP